MTKNEIFRNVEVEGDLRTGGELRVRGRTRLERDVSLDSALDVKGDVRTEGSLRVRGLLEAGDFVGMLKGLFPSEARLCALYPRPRDGMTALVGDTLPADLFRAEHRRWVATGEKAGEPSLPLDTLGTRIDKEAEERAKADSLLDARVTLLEDYFICKDSYVYSYDPEEERREQKDFECTPYLVLPDGCDIDVTGYEHSDVCAPVTFYDKNFGFIGRKLTGSNGVKTLRVTAPVTQPEGVVYMRVNALKGQGRVEVSGGVRLASVDSATARQLRRERSEVSERLDILAAMVSLGTEQTTVTPKPDTYYNLRGVRAGDRLETVQPEPTREEGLWSGCVSFARDGRRLLTLTSHGTDMIRNYCALDADLKVVAISAVGDYDFTARTVMLPATTRHLLLQSYSAPFEATVCDATGADTDILTRSVEPVRRAGLCYDFGADGEPGDFFDESDIKHVASIPDSEIIVLKWRSAYRLTVTMNTGTPNVWGVAYIAADNRIIGREYPLRRDYVKKRLIPPEGCDRVVLQTYDPSEFPMEVTVEYNLLDMLDSSMESGEFGACGGHLPHSGEKWLLLGDSMLEISDETGKKLSDYLASATGADITDCGIGGTRLTRRKDISQMTLPGNSNDCYALLDVVSLVEAMTGDGFSRQRAAVEMLALSGDDNSRALALLESAALGSIDRIVILAGTNDYASGVSATLDTASVTDSLYGAVYRIVERVQRTLPRAVLCLCTPPPRLADTSDLTTFSDSYRMPGAVSLLPEICAAIKEAAGRWHLPTADLYNSLGWSRFNYAAQCDPGDGTHPRKGLRRMAAVIAAAT